MAQGRSGAGRRRRAWIRPAAAAIATVAFACVESPAVNPGADAGASSGWAPESDAGTAGDSWARLDAGPGADAGSARDSGPGADSGGGDAASDAGATLSSRVSAWATGRVEVFVNGASVGKSGGDGMAFSALVTLSPGSENLIALRATGGAAASPSVLGEIQGVFGRAGTTERWKVKAATGSELTDSAGPWTQLSYDDSSWSSGAAIATSLPAGFPSGGPAEGLWTASNGSAVLARLKLYVPGDLNAEEPRGFGRAATGGAGGAVARPTTLADLASALCSTKSGSTCTDATPRIVEISQEFNFIDTEGSKTSTGCNPYTVCSSPTASEICLDSEGGCSGKSTFDVTYDAAGVDPLLVGSNKTLIGVGNGARLKGKGLTLRGGVSNIVIRNIEITDLNPQVVWGGDALTIDNADRVWVDHNRFSLIGRQMLVTGWGKASNVTVSWNEFDGHTPYAAYCDGAHYWVSLNLGSADTLTLLGNWIHHTSGRGPHAGGYAGVNVLMHLLNNAYEDVTGHAMNPMSTDSSPQSRLLAEANHFARVEKPVMLDSNPGLIYAPASDAAACQSALGRDCAANVAAPLPSSGWPPPLDNAALSGVAGAAPGSLPAPFPAAEVPNVVPHLAGVGHL